MYHKRLRLGERERQDGKDRQDSHNIMNFFLSWNTVHISENRQRKYLLLQRELRPRNGRFHVFRQP